MTTSNVEETLAAAGYAKVIVSLKPGVAAATANRRTMESSIENHFIIPSEQQIESLAASARRFASRSFTRSTPATERRVRVYPNISGLQ